MKTKEKVLAAALNLFNAYGLDAVTLRQIAQAIGISQGNLNYHFPKKEDLVEALYQQLVDRINLDFNHLKEVNMALMFEVGRRTLKALYDYRFLMLDFVRVMKQHPAIQDHYKQLFEGRKQQYQVIFNVFQEKKLMQEEEYPGQFEYLKTQLTILGDYWISSAEVLKDDLSESEKINYYLKTLVNSFYPYLTSEGKKEFLELMEKI